MGVALLAYANSFGLGLAGDARLLVKDDLRIREVSPRNLKAILRTNYEWPSPGNLYRPVTTASMLFNYAILGNGENAGGYHLVNVLLHAVNVLLAFELAFLLFNRRWPAFFAAALWAAHPITTEAVANVAGRADLLAAMSVLGGLLLYVRTAALSGRRQVLAAAALFLVAAAGLLSKENAAILPGLVALWDVTFGREAPAPPRRRLPAYGAVGLSLAVVFAVRFAVLRSLPGVQDVYLDNPLLAAGFWRARFTAIKVAGMYLRLLVFPIHQSSDYSYNQIPLAGWQDWAAWLSALALVTIASVAASRFRKDPVLFFLVGFFGIALLPVSNLIVPIGSIMAERFLYLPSLGFTMAVAALGCRAARQKYAVPAVVVVTIAYAGLTLTRTLDWEDGLALASADLKTAPGSFKLHEMYAKALYEKEGDRALDAAIREAETAWAIVAKLPLAYSSELPPGYLGIYYGLKAVNLGEPANPLSRPWYEKSVEALLRAKEISRATQKAFDEAQLARGKPLAARAGMPLLYYTLGNDYLSLGRPQDALDALRYGAGIDPNFTLFYEGIAKACLAIGQRQNAVIALEQMGLIDGFSASTEAAAVWLYAQMEGANCAIRADQAERRLDFTCPRVRSDVCAAAAGLADLFTEARKPSSSDAVRKTAASRYACSPDR